MTNQPGQKRIALFFFEMFTTGFNKVTMKSGRNLEFYWSGLTVLINKRTCLQGPVYPTGCELSQAPQENELSVSIISRRKD